MLNIRVHKNKNIIIEFLGQIVDKGRLNERTERRRKESIRTGND